MRKITDSELNRVLQRHQKWIDSGRKKGNRADLRWIDLRDSSLSGVSLQSAYLCYADLRGTDLRGTDLLRTDLLGADLRGAQLDTNIRHCLTLYRARFTADALPWLILYPEWVEMQKTVRIEEAAA